MFPAAISVPDHKQVVWSQKQKLSQQYFAASVTHMPSSPGEKVGALLVAVVFEVLRSNVEPPACQESPPALDCC